MERYGLIGAKLAHSFSKIIHEEIMDYTYDLIELNEDEFKDFFTKKKFSALNITIPYKKAVMPYLNFIDDKAKSIGAVNTVVNKEGKLYGYNTDYYGLVSLIQKNKIEVKDRNVLILGTGGTSNTAFAVFNDLGAKSIVKVTRDKDDNAITYEEAKNRKETNIIFNATPCGMYPNNDNCLIDLDDYPKLEGVLDAIYNPINTKLIVAAKEKGLKADGGLYMLVAQAVKAIEYFKDIKLDEGILDRVYTKLLKEKQNIVLIGMPGCGKTTISKGLNSNKKRIDSDEEIVKKENRSIPEIFKSEGEDGFREIETKIIKEISKEGGQIIATGGGVILRKENMQALKQNGIIYYLKTPLEKLEVGNGRPLTSNREALEKKFEERKDLYELYADVIIDNEYLSEAKKEIEAYEN